MLKETVLAPKHLCANGAPAGSPLRSIRDGVPGKVMGRGGHSGRKRIALIFGTRPEAIKLCPLVCALRDHPRLAPHVCVTGQHREMLDQVLEVFGVSPDVDLNLMTRDQSLAGLTARVIAGVDSYLETHQPEMVMVQGDTTTTFATALASFYRRIPVAHVEAGLRTGNRFSPFPEEINRVATARLADLHFAPTRCARENLLREGIPPDRVFTTGNTVIDALLMAVEQTRKRPPTVAGLPPYLQPSTTSSIRPRIVLITGHRRENFGQGLENICRAVGQLATRFRNVHFIYPVHLNPNVREPAGRILGALAGNNVHLIAPLAYFDFIALMDASHLVLTDSGGVQEEAPSLGKPVLVMRNTTERPEAVEMGTVKLVGTTQQTIVEGISALLTDDRKYAAMANADNPYGDGRACERIVRRIGDYAEGTRDPITTTPVRPFLLQACG